MERDVGAQSSPDCGTGTEATTWRPKMKENLEKDLLSMSLDCSSALTPALLMPSAVHIFCSSLFIMPELFTLRTSGSGSKEPTIEAISYVCAIGRGSDFWADT